MSEASTADLTPPAGTPALVADTAITGAAGDEGQQSSEAGQGDAPQGEGQGAGNETGTEGAASAESEQIEGEEGGDALGAPEQYADFSVPDGVELAGEMLDSLTTFAKAHNLTQDQAQGLVDLGVKQAQTIMGQITETALANPVFLAEHWAGEWSKQTAADPTLGGDKLTSTMALTGRVFATFGSPELGDFLVKTGLTHHPELIRFMHKVGQAVSEDTLVTPRGGNQRGEPIGQNTAKKLYPGMN